MTSREITARVESIEPLTDSIVKLVLAPESFIDYEAGQYLKIHLAHELLAYSIANAPLGSQKYELHLRHSQNNPSNQRLLAEMKNRGALTLSLPYGDCYLNMLDADKPIVFMAIGTGFAPVKAMIEQLLATSDKRLFELYWGARSQSDLYMDAKVAEWQNHVKNFRYFSFYPQAKDQQSLAERVLNHLKSDILNFQIVISGPFDRVFAAKETLEAHGVKTKQLFSDAFSFTGKSK